MYRLKRWHPSQIKPGQVCVLIGKKGSGKTTALADICYHLRSTPDVLLFQKTYLTNEIFHDVIPRSFVHTEWRKDVIAKAIKRQTKRNAKRLNRGRAQSTKQSLLTILLAQRNFSKTRS